MIFFCMLDIRKDKREAMSLHHDEQQAVSSLLFLSSIHRETVTNRVCLSLLHVYVRTSFRITRTNMRDNTMHIYSGVM